MKRPSVSTRLAGSPLGALLLLALCAWLMLDWYQGGGVPWWIALGAVGGVFRVFGALGRMRRYKAWLADWQAMGAEEESPRGGQEPRAGNIRKADAAGALSGTGRRRLWKRLTWAAALVLTVPVWIALSGARGPLPDVIAVPWCAALIFLLCRLFARVFRMLFRRGAPHARRVEASAEGGHVASLLGVPSSSPSRADAERQLPDYCTRLLESGPDA